MKISASLTTRLFLRAALGLFAVIAVVATAMTMQHLRGEQLRADLEMHRVGERILADFTSFERAARGVPADGALSPAARTALAGVAAGLEHLLDPRHGHRPAAIDAARAAVTRLDEHLAAHPDAARVTALRGEIESARELVETVVAECAGHFTQAVEEFVDHGRTARAVVGSVLSAVLLVLLVFAFHTVRRFVRPLQRAVALARQIGSGAALDDFDVEPRADTGNLLATMREMQANLLRHRQQAEAHSALLQQRVAELAASRASLDEAHRLAKIGTWNWDLANGSVQWSPQLCSNLGLTGTAPTPGLRAFLRTVPREERPPLLDELRILRHAPGERCCEHRALSEADMPRVLLHRVCSEHDAQGRLLRLHGTVQDISERRRARDEIQRLARYDALTRLPNRATLSERLSGVIAEKGGAGVFFINIDRFRRINASLGQGAGDRVLAALAQRLVDATRTASAAPGQPATREGMFAARFAGDEFVVVLPGFVAPQELGAWAERLIAALTAPLRLDAEELTVAVRVGIALASGHAADAGTLIGNAASACALARSTGLNAYRFFTTDMNEAVAAKLRIEGELRHAVDTGNQFFLLYQPKIDLDSGRMVGVEALIRWRHPTRGVLTPAAFIGLAEECGLISSIGCWVIGAVAVQLAQWQANGLDPVPVAINISGECFRNERFAAGIATTCRRHAVDPGRIVIEITESVLMVDAGSSMSAIAALTKAGFRLSVDDFGTGYSSLAYLHRFPIDELKIDRSFVRNIGNPGGEGAIVAAIVALGHNLGMDVVAEGVETAEQAQLLRAHGCRYAQGYLFARPLDAGVIAEMLHADRVFTCGPTLRVA